MDINIENAESVLCLNDIYISSASYKKSSNDNDKENNKTFAFKCTIAKSDKDAINIFLSTTIKTENDIAELYVEVCGIFSFEGEITDNVLIHKLLTQNTIAIVFPYLRTYVSNFSSMTDMGTINLPIFNIGKAFEQSMHESESSKNL